jgi:hypothetical protein
MSDQRHISHASDEHAADAPPAVALAFTHGGDRSDPGSPHAGKFRFVTGALAGIAIAALLVAASVLVRGGTTGPGPRWSTWKPHDGVASGAQEIADHLAPLYRINGVDQLSVVTVSNLSPASSSANSSTSGLEVAVRPDAQSSAISLLSGNTIAYNLCGIGGSDCSISVGAPSSGRLLLLRREALELALYTFKYISDTQNVVALLPPGHTTQTSTLTSSLPKSTGSKTVPVHIALLFLHDELKPFLQSPLSDTLPLQYPPLVSQVPQWSSSQEAALVEQVTARGMFNQHLSAAQDGSNLIVLDPLPPQ